MWVPTVSAAIASLTAGADLLGPGQLAKSGAATVYFISGPNTKIPITSFSLAAEYGSTGYSVVSDATLGGYTTSASSLGIVATCGTASYVAGGGALYALAGGNTTGLTASVVDAAACSVLPHSGISIATTVFLRSPSTGKIYSISGGTKHFMSTMTAIIALNGGTVPPFVPSSDATLASIPDGAAG